MGKVTVPYYVVRNGRAYWQPSAKMRRLGFATRPLGEAGPEARARADALNLEWQRVRRGDLMPTPASHATPETLEATIRYRKGTIGEAFQKFLTTPEWAKKAPGTRAHIWWPAWRRRIRPVYGDCLPDTLTLADLSDWQAAVTARDGIDAAHKAMKVWRSFWKIMQGLGFTTRPDPSTGIRNTQPDPRKERWREGEVVRLVKAAWRASYPGLAVVVAAIWDTSFQPGDVRRLRTRHLAMGTEGLLFDLTGEGREKTGAAALGTLSKRTQMLLAEYLVGRGVTLAEEAPLFVNRAGRAYRMDTLCDDFAKIRNLVFPGDRRQMRDMRRSGASEAVAGRVDRDALAAKLANSIAASDRLWKTYVRVEEVSVRLADKARVAARAGLRAKAEPVIDLEKMRRRRSAEG